MTCKNVDFLSFVTMDGTRMVYFRITFQSSLYKMIAA